MKLYYQCISKGYNVRGGFQSCLQFTKSMRYLRVTYGLQPRGVFGCMIFSYGFPGDIIMGILPAPFLKLTPTVWEWKMDPEWVDVLPIEYRDIPAPASYVSLPEGSSCLCLISILNHNVVSREPERHLMTFDLHFLLVFDVHKFRTLLKNSFVPVVSWRILKK